MWIYFSSKFNGLKFRSGKTIRKISSLLIQSGEKFLEVSSHRFQLSAWACWKAFCCWLDYFRCVIFHQFVPEQGDLFLVLQFWIFQCSLQLFAFYCVLCFSFWSSISHRFCVLFLQNFQFGLQIEDSFMLHLKDLIQLILILSLLIAMINELSIDFKLLPGLLLN